ncbi:MAG TPA: FtsX-like permease family protein [Actinomycetota bacterium]|nr:FtsX-like permease family protein [Actinomycetota bacterium]
MSMSSYRAVARVAWRQAWLARWRSILVVVMVALPVAALTGAAVVIRTATQTDPERIVEALGTADFELYWTREVTAEELASQLPAGTRIATEGYLQVPPIVQANHIIYFSLYEFDVPADQPPLLGRFVVLDGRAATQAGEVAVHPDVLEDFGAHIGDVISPRSSLSLRVVGTVALAGDLNSPIGVVGPGTLASIGRTLRGGWLLDLPPGADVASVRTSLGPLGRGGVFGAVEVLQNNRHTERNATGGAFAATTLLLLGSGLIVRAAFAVGARRQLRTLGLIGAAGAEPRHLRATVLMGGVTLGAVGSLAGVGVGVAGAFALHPHLDRLAGRFVGPIEVPFASLAGAVVLGTIAATLSALGPARAAGKLSVLQALSQRMPPPSRPGRLAGAGLLGVGAGVLIISWGTAAASSIVLTVGLATMIVGFLLAIPLLVAWTGRVAGSLPTPARIATRDVARHGRRAGAALAAATIALAAPVAIATITLSDEAQSQPIPLMADDQLRIDGYGSGRSGVDAVQRAAESLRDAFPNAAISPLVPAVTLEDRHGQERERLIVVEGPMQTTSDGVRYRPNGYLLVGGAELLRAFHAEDGVDALERGEVVGIGPETVEGGTLDLFNEGLSPYRRDVSATAAGETAFSSVGQTELNFVVTPERATELGLRPSANPGYGTSVLFRAPRSLSDGDIQHVRDVLVDDRLIGVTSLDDMTDDAGLVRTVATLGGMGLALAIVAVVVALLAAESRRDRAILVAIGAGPMTRRTVAGLYAAVVGGLAGVLALFSGFVPVTVLLFGQKDDYPIVIPWIVMGGVLLGVPAIAGVIGGLVSRRPEAAQLLRPIA